MYGGFEKGPIVVKTAVITYVPVAYCDQAKHSDEARVNRALSESRSAYGDYEVMQILAGARQICGREYGAERRALYLGPF